MGSLKPSNTLEQIEVDQLLDSIISEENIIDAKNILKAVNAKGDGYMSFLTNVEIVGKNKNLSIVIKCAPQSEDFRKLAPIRVIFEREIIVYDQVIPTLLKFQEERKIERPFNKFAKCYKTSLEENKELIVLENIKTKGFKLWNRKYPMDDQHLCKIFEEYGKLHAISYAMKEENPKLYNSLIKQLPDIFTMDDTNAELYDSFVNAYDLIYEYFDQETENEVYNRIVRFKDEIRDFFKFIETEKGEHSVITHGDCWCNNMMFKYEDPSNPNEPTDMCLLDFQMTMIASPARDLSYAFYVSADQAALDKLDDYLHIYHDSFTKHIDSLGSEAGKRFTYETLQNEWKTFGKFGFLCAISLVKMMLRDPEDVVDFNDVAENGYKLSDIFQAKTDDAYRIRMRDIAFHMCKHDFI